jgi:tetratricopeptide (TPR) repeat protein
LNKLYIAIFIFISGCAPAINNTNANNYYNAGLSAETSRNYLQAKEMYYRALVNARSANASKEYISAVLYNYGRMLGFTCDFGNAIESVKESLSIEKGISPTNNTNLAKRLSELAYLNVALGLDSEAAVYFSGAVPILESLGVGAKDPIGYANYLEMYAAALRNSNQIERSNEFSNKAKILNSKNPDAKAQFIPVNYKAGCAKNF